MSQFVKKGIDQSVVHVSNVSSGSKSSAPYELACMKGVRNTSFVPAEPRPGRGGLLGLVAKDMEAGKKKDELMKKVKKASEPVEPVDFGFKKLFKCTETPDDVNTLDICFTYNTYATWSKGNPQYEMDIGGGSWEKIYNDNTNEWKEGKELEKIKKAISDRKAIKPFIGITGGNPDKRTEKLKKLGDRFGKGVFHSLTEREERQWTFKSVRKAMYALTKHRGTFTMIALGSTDLHVIDPNTDNLGKTYRDVGIKGKGEKPFKPDKYIESMQTELKAKGKNALVWISGSLSYFIKGINGLKKEGKKIKLNSGDVYVTSIEELNPGTREEGVDEAYRYNFAILEQIIGKDFKGRIIIGARK